MALKVLIIKDLFSARTGGSKLTLDMARGLRSIGNDVKIVFFHHDGTGNLLESQLRDIEYEFYGDGILFRLSQLFQIPILKLFLKDAFHEEDAINFMGQLAYSRFLGRRGETFDIVISMSIWTGLTYMLLSDFALHTKTALYFYEPPIFSGLPLPIRLLLKIYMRLVLKKTTLNVSITDAVKQLMQKKLSLNSVTVSASFLVKSSKIEKEDYVLADTRWTYVRDPFFIIEIARLLPTVKFKMCGSFASEDIREKFLHKLEMSGFGDRIFVYEHNSEDSLDSLYSNAKCYIRWSNKEIDETGPSYGLIQAVSNGCVPIISDNLGSSSDVIRNLGEEYVVQNDASQFALAIRRLFEDQGYFSQSVKKVISWRDRYTTQESSNLLLAYISGTQHDLQINGTE